MTSRILGMGDMLSIIEAAEENFDEAEALKLEKKLAKEEFDLDDYLAQLKQVKKMGSFSSLLKMIPGMANVKDLKVDEREFVRIEAIICSMTKAEKKDIKLLNAKRRLRIANGSGTRVQDINKFINSYEQTLKFMKRFKDPKQMSKLSKGFNMNDLKNFK